MASCIRVAGLDPRGLLLEASVLRRGGHLVQESEGGRALLEALADGTSRLAIIGPQLPDFTLPDLVRRIRTDTLTRRVSVLALVPGSEPPTIEAAVMVAGANAVLRRPLDGDRLNAWVAKLLSVPRRIMARIPVQGHVVGTPRSAGTSGHFLGLTRNLSVNGLLLASPVRLESSPDVDLEMLVEDQVPVRALGRIVREAAEVAWPYLGYGVEFLYLPDDSLSTLMALVSREMVPAPRVAEVVQPPLPIRSTLRRESWIYEILEPVRQRGNWQVEIRRAPREGWRPGLGGPFYVVEAESPEGALVQARTFLSRHV
jgi:CheY-like chemotaxis protein